jgi:hypothetical protein
MPTQIEDDGTFTIDSVARVRHNLTVVNLPEGLYVSSIRAGNVDVLEHGIDLSAVEAAPPLEVRVSSKGAALEGLVRNDDKPAPAAIVVLLPHPLKEQSPPMLRKMATADQSGRFKMSGIAPGEYRVYALQEYLPFHAMQPDELKQLEPFSVAVKLKPESLEQIELKLAVGERR